MEYKLTDAGLFCRTDKKYQRIGGSIRVKARTRLPGLQRGHGALLEWQNHDGEVLKEIVYARDLHGDRSRQIRDMLIDTGYNLAPGQSSWGLLQYYLLEEMTTADPATVVNRTGWHGRVFATDQWTAGEVDEPHYYVGRLSGSSVLAESGSLAEWCEHVGLFCQGNPLAIFAVGMALAAPLLEPAGMENGAFHLVGASSSGKTTLLQIAASVYGDSRYLRSWISTTNGLAAVATEHHDMLLPLDEIGMARPEDIDAAIYQIMNGAGKLRANIYGDLAETTHWRTLVLSSGEVWIGEILQQIGKTPRAGQQIRLVEIPVFGCHGVFDNLHGRDNAQQFVDELKASCQRYHGSVIRPWVEFLTQNYDELPQYLTKEISRLTAEWTSPQMASQVQRVGRRFALVAAALSLGCRNFILPWPEKESQNAVCRVFSAWLANRGHTRNSEEYRILKALERAMKIWERGLVDEHSSDYRHGKGYRRMVGGYEFWLIPKTEFLQRLGLPTHYMREVEVLLQRECLASNERVRGTYRARINGEFRRFFAVRPERIRTLLADLERVEDDD